MADRLTDPIGADAISPAAAFQLIEDDEEDAAVATELSQQEHVPGAPDVAAASDGFQDDLGERSSLLPSAKSRSSRQSFSRPSLRAASENPHDSDDDAGAEELFQAMELEMEARAPSNAAYLAVQQSPTARAIAWVLSFAIPGLGMFTEAYFVFSVGNLMPLFQQEYPKCWVTHEECGVGLLESIHYTQVGGIIAGQLSLGYLADRIGRKWGSVVTAATMLMGGVLLACSNGPSVYSMFVMYTLSQTIFGVGVGGEYPIASTSASERAEADASLQHRRGETVMLTFSMQGWGNFSNTAVLALLLLIFGQTGPGSYDNEQLELTWRLSFILGLIPVAGMLIWRLFILEESAVWREKQKKLQQEGKKREFDLWKAACWARTYWHRLAGTAASWFVWDFAFYGNRLFQGTFIGIFNPGATVVQVLRWTLVNSTVSLIGYYAAAFTVDKPWMGRRRMQIMGFAWMFVLFALCAWQYSALTKPRLLWVFSLLYYLSSFFGQWGPNATTWLLPSELFPTETRAMSHGLAAATGKVGALVAGVVFGLVPDRTKFYISALCGLLGMLLTYVLVPDISGLDLEEGDKRWILVLEGHGADYHGEAVNPKHLSVLEVLLGYGRQYNKPGARGQGQTKGLHRALSSSQEA